MISDDIREMLLTIRDPMNGHPYHRWHAATTLVKKTATGVKISTDLETKLDAWRQTLPGWEWRQIEQRTLELVDDALSETHSPLSTWELHEYACILVLITEEQHRRWTQGTAPSWIGQR